MEKAKAEAGNWEVDNSPAPGFSRETQNRSDRNSWEPRDEVKGKVARILFYMATRYEGEGREPDLVLTNQITNGSSKAPYHGKFSVLLKWYQ